MSFANLLRSAAGTCRYCGNKAGVLTRDHPECRRTFDVGWNRMVEIAADAVRYHAFDEKNLRLSLTEIARNSHGRGEHREQSPGGRLETGRRPCYG